MAYYSSVSLLFFFFFFFFGPHEVNARESKFFSKVTRHISKADNNQVTQISLSDAPAASPDQLGYGLYGGDEARYETRYDDENSHYFYGKNDEQLKPQAQGMSDTRFLDNGSYSRDNFENNNHDESGETERYVFDSMEEYEKYQDNHAYLP